MLSVFSGKAAIKASMAAGRKTAILTQQKRNIYRFPLKSDVNITKTGKTKIAIGQGGRSSRTGYTVSVFGGSGFLGRIITSKLAKMVH